MSKRFSSSICPAPSWWSATGRRARSWPRPIPTRCFSAPRQGEALAEIYAAADVFVFPSRTDTFGLVLLEALASGVPVAGFPAAAPRDVIGEAPVGVLDEDLRRACLGALECSRDDCREFALGMTWEASARIFLEHVTEAAKAARGKPRGSRLKRVMCVAIQYARDEAASRVAGMPLALMSRIAALALRHGRHRHHDPADRRRYRGRGQAACRRRGAHAADQCAGARRAARRARVPESRDAAAHRLVQVPRRL